MSSAVIVTGALRVNISIHGLRKLKKERRIELAPRGINRICIDLEIRPSFPWGLKSIFF